MHSHFISGTQQRMNCYWPELFKATYSTCIVRAPHLLYCHGTYIFSAGYSVCLGGYLSVQYYGEERVLQIKSITPLDLADTSNITPIKEKLSEQFSTLSLTSDPQKTEPLSAHSSPNTSVYKITAKTKIIIQSKENSPNSSSSKVSHSVYICADCDCHP